MEKQETLERAKAALTARELIEGSLLEAMKQRDQADIAIGAARRAVYVAQDLKASFQAQIDGLHAQREGSNGEIGKLLLVLQGSRDLGPEATAVIDGLGGVAAAASNRGGATLSFNLRPAGTGTVI